MIDGGVLAGALHVPLLNITLTPYVAGAPVRTVRVAAGEVRRFVTGEPLLNPC